jgi:hypothetical protein
LSRNVAGRRNDEPPKVAATPASHRLSGHKHLLRNDRPRLEQAGQEYANPLLTVDEIVCFPKAHDLHRNH